MPWKHLSRPETYEEALNRGSDNRIYGIGANIYGMGYPGGVPGKRKYEYGLYQDGTQKSVYPPVPELRSIDVMGSGLTYVYWRL